MNVITISGETIDKKLTRKIKNLQNEFAYYKIGNINQKDSGDCYQINNIFYTVEKGRIVWDEYFNQYVLKTTTVEGIVDATYRRGFFNKNINNMAVVFLNAEPVSELCISTDLAEQLGLINGEGNLYYNPEYYTYDQILPRQVIDRNYKNSLQYNFKHYIAEATKSYEKFNIVKDNRIELYYKDIKTLLETYSFGVEIETTYGMIPIEVYDNLGVRPVRDGSITGLEYVTIPLAGKKGLYAFVKIVEAINKYTSSDYTCSMHIHVGNIPRTMEFIVAMFKTMYHLQDEIYRLFPLYKQFDNGIKRQCYTAPLSSHVMSSLNYACKDENDLKDDYQKIVYELSGKHPNYKKFIDLSNIENHPFDPSESSKWQMKSRYKIQNLIPLIFTNKQTVEYRIFTVPNNIDKAINFLTLALSITHFVDLYKSNIIQSQGCINPLTLYKIFDYTLDNKYNQHEYLQRRESVVRMHVNNKGGFFEERDINLNYGKTAKNMVEGSSRIPAAIIDELREELRTGLRFSTSATAERRVSFSDTIRATR